MNLLNIDEDVFLDEIYPLLDDQTLLALSQVCSFFQRPCLSALFGRHSVSESDIQSGVIAASSAAPLRALRRSPLFQPIRELKLRVRLCALCHNVKPICDFFKTLPLIPLVDVQILDLPMTDGRYVVQNPGGAIESVAEALIANRKVAVVIEDTASVQDFRANAIRDTQSHTESPPLGGFLAVGMVFLLRILYAIGMWPSHGYAIGSSTAKTSCHSRARPRIAWAWVRQISWTLPVSPQGAGEQALPVMIMERDSLEFLSIARGEQAFPLRSVTFPLLIALKVQSSAKIEWDEFVEFLSRHKDIQTLELQSYSLELPDTELPATVAAPFISQLCQISAPARIMAPILEMYRSSMPELHSICINAAPDTPRTSNKESLDFEDLSATFDAIASIQRNDIHITLSLPASGAKVLNWLANSHNRVALPSVKRLNLWAEDWKRWDGSLTPLLPQWLGDTFPQLTCLIFVDCVSLFMRHADEVAFEEEVLARCSGLHAESMYGHRFGTMADGRMEDYYDTSETWPSYGSFVYG